MSTSPMVALNPATVRRLSPAAASSLSTEMLTCSDASEVLSFLSRRPLHTVALTGFIRDNGLESPLNRGRFYGSRNRAGELEGVALIGHATLFETENPDALAIFADIARRCSTTHLLMGESEKVSIFWRAYAESDVSTKRFCRELLYEQRWPVEVFEPVRGLRQASLLDLAITMPVHAEMARQESGTNPLEVDPTGFRLRCARRIEQGRVWVCTEGNRLIFKADVVADTPGGMYLEGIYTSRGERGKGYGLRCLSQLSRMLLLRTKSLCLLVNEHNQRARRLYERAGYKLRGEYDTIFLNTNHKGGHDQS